MLLVTGFLWLRRAGATLRCGARASQCSGFSCCGARALGARGLQQLHQASSVAVARGLSSHGTRALEHRLSSCGARAWLLCGIFPDQGLNCVPCIDRWILNHCATREVPSPHFFSPSILLPSHNFSYL